MILITILSIGLCAALAEEWAATRAELAHRRGSPGRGGASAPAARLAELEP
jgi:hypothetical protein